MLIWVISKEKGTEMPYVNLPTLQGINRKHADTVGPNQRADWSSDQDLSGRDRILY